MAQVVRRVKTQEESLLCSRSHLKLLRSNAAIGSCNSGAETYDPAFQLLSVDICAAGRNPASLSSHVPSEVPESRSSSRVLGFVAERLLQRTEYDL